MPHLQVSKKRLRTAQDSGRARAAILAARNPHTLILAADLAAKVEELEVMAGDAWEDGQRDRSLGITASIEVIRQLFRVL